MGQNVNYDAVVQDCGKIIELSSNVLNISNTLKYSYMTTQNQGEFSESFEALMSDVDGAIVDIGNIIRGYADLLLAVLENYHNIDQGMKDIINEN